MIAWRGSGTHVRRDGWREGRMEGRGWLRVEQRTIWGEGKKSDICKSL